MTELPSGEPKVMRFAAGASVYPLGGRELYPRTRTAQQKFFARLTGTAIRLSRTASGVTGTNFYGTGTHFYGTGTRFYGVGTGFYGVGTDFGGVGTHFCGVGAGFCGIGTDFCGVGTHFGGVGTRPRGDVTSPLAVGNARFSAGAAGNGAETPASPFRMTRRGVGNASEQARASPKQSRATTAGSGSRPA
jgi:hypothetical protein